MRPLVAALVVAGLAAPGVGRGWLNGDIAAYVAQAVHGDLTDRFTHVGYIALATALAPLAGSHLTLWLDVLGVLALAATVALVTREAGARGYVGPVVAGAALLPWAPFAEVDPVWIALVTAAAVGTPGAFLLAVTVSPVALLAAPWVAMVRGDPRGVVVEAGVAVVGLTVASGGDWWFGPRGVLEHPNVRFDRALLAWGRHLPFALGLLAGGRALGPLVALTPLLLAPPDVPTHGLVGVAWGLTLARTGVAPWAHRGVVAAALAVGTATTVAEGVRRGQRVAAEHAVVEHVAAHWAVGDGLVAPWTWGARVAVAVSGDPYGIPWHPPEGWLRDQEATWEAAAVRRIAALPAGTGAGVADDHGVRWAEVEPRGK